MLKILIDFWLKHQLNYLIKFDKSSKMDEPHQPHHSFFYWLTLS